MPTLWKRFGGEPFLVNPHLGVLGVNPKERKRKHMAKKWGRSHMAWVRSFQKKRHNPRRKTYHARRNRKRSYRRNPYPMAGLVINRRRRRHSGVHYSRNPKLFGFELPNLMDVVYGGVGFVGVPILESFANPYLPASITTNTIGKYGVKIGIVALETWLAKMVFGRRAATVVAIGGGSYVLISAVKEFAPPEVKSFLGLNAYKVPTSGPTAMAGMGTYPRTIGQNRTTLGAPAYGAQRSARFAGGGGANVVANRFRRFQ